MEVSNSLPEKADGPHHDTSDITCTQRWIAASVSCIRSRWRIEQSHRKRHGPNPDDLKDIEAGHSSRFASLVVETRIFSTGFDHAHQKKNSQSGCPYLEHRTRCLCRLCSRWLTMTITETMILRAWYVPPRLRVTSAKIRKFEPPAKSLMVSSPKTNIVTKARISTTNQQCYCFSNEVTYGILAWSMR